MLEIAFVQTCARYYYHYRITQEGFLRYSTRFVDAGPDGHHPGTV